MEKSIFRRGRRQFFSRIGIEFAKNHRNSKITIEMQAQIQAQSIQISTNAPPTYAAVARIPLTNYPSNLRSISNTILSTMIDTLN